MVNGASRHSNGATGGAPAKSSFVAEMLASGYKYHHRFPPSVSYYLNVGEAFSIAAEFAAVRGRRLHVDLRRALKRVIKEEYFDLRRGWLKPQIEEFARLNGLALPRLPEIADRAPVTGTPAPRLMERANGSVVFRSGLLPLHNVYEASRLAGHVLNDSDLVPHELRSVPLRTRLKSALRDSFFMGGRPLSRVPQVAAQPPQQWSTPRS
jgi:hypothetical protein